MATATASSWLTGHTASAGLTGAAATEADRAFAAGFGHQAVSLAAEYARTGASLAASRRPPGSPHPDPALANKGWEVGRYGIYQRTAATTADTGMHEELEAG